MPTDPPDRGRPSGADDGPAWDPSVPSKPERATDAAFLRPRPRPLTSPAPEGDPVRLDRGPRPLPVARVGGSDAQVTPPPWERESEAPPRRTPPWAAAPPRAEVDDPYADAARSPGVIPRESTDEVRLPDARLGGEPRGFGRAEPPRAEPPRAEPPRAEPLRPPSARPAGIRLGETRPGDAAARIDVATPGRPGGTGPTVEIPDQARWQPREPRTWDEAGLDPLLGEQLALRYFALTGTESARQVANDLCLALPLVKDLLEQLKAQKLLQHRGSTAMGDFIYELTDAGRSKAIDYKRLCAYVGPAPVPFSTYLQSVRDQTLRTRSPTPADLHRAFEDLLVSDDLVQRLGPAITSGRALFLHGDPGNGKTSIAERITRCFGDEIWIPHALLIDGHLVKLYDPATHVAVDPNFKPLTPSERLDRRWVKIQRPTVVAGGELTLEMLEIQLNPSTNIGEAPLQLKANCGTLVIDDFGRQRIEPQLLLNRWIFPLERRVDFLRLPDGRKITSPFDPLLIFSTNLEPSDLVDEAFLRRIPYKIQVQDPTEDEFRMLVEIVASKLDVILAEGAVDYLIETHYQGTGRKFRFCHPRDLLLQVVNKAAYERRPRIARTMDFDHAVSNYFGAM